MNDDRFEVNREETGVTFGWIDGDPPTRIKLAVVFEDPTVTLADDKLAAVGLLFADIVRVVR